MCIPDRWPGLLLHVPALETCHIDPYTYRYNNGMDVHVSYDLFVSWTAYNETCQLDHRYDKGVDVNASYDLCGSCIAEGLVFVTITRCDIYMLEALPIVI